MRAFIALKLPSQIKEYLSRIQDELKTCAADLKLVKPEYIHLTLKFLGEINAEQLKTVTTLLEKTVADNPSFKISLASLNAFPDITAPRIIWFGITQGASQIKAITASIENYLTATNILKDNREFSAHITIARTKSPRNLRKLSAKIVELKNGLGSMIYEFTANKLTLFRSTLTPQGPIYEIIKEFPLIGAGSS